MKSEERRWFFKIYYLAVSHAIFKALKAHFPGSKSIISTKKFKMEIFVLISELLTGIRLSPSCIQQIDQKLFPTKEGNFLEMIRKKQSGFEKGFYSSGDENSEDEFIMDDEKKNHPSITPELNPKKMYKLLSCLKKDNRFKKYWNCYSTSPLISYYIDQPVVGENVRLLKKNTSHSDPLFFGEKPDIELQKKFKKNYLKEWIFTNSRAEYLKLLRKEALVKQKYNEFEQKFQRDMETIYQKSKKKLEKLEELKREREQDKSGEKFRNLCSEIIHNAQKTNTSVNFKKMQNVEAGQFRGTTTALYIQDTAMSIESRFHKLDNLLDRQKLRKKEKTANISYKFVE